MNHHILFFNAVHEERRQMCEHDEVPPTQTHVKIPLPHLLAAMAFSLGVWYGVWWVVSRFIKAVMGL